MKVRFFQVDQSDQIQRISQRLMEACWFGQRPFDCSTGLRPLRIISFLCDDMLRPLRGFVLRLETKDGFISQESIEVALEAAHSARPRLYGPQPTELPLIEEQFDDWPEPHILFPRLAVALDVPLNAIPRLYFGGPLIMASFMHVSVKQSLMYFDVTTGDE